MNVIDGPMVNRIIAGFRRLNRRQLVDGLFWYQMARAECASMVRPRLSTLRAAAVVAARSPRLRWPANLRLAKRDVATGKAIGGLFAPRTQALLDGERIGAHVRGPKTRSFWISIVRSGRTSAVCVDRHAARLAYGPTVPRLEVHLQLARPGEYDRIATAYREASRVVGLYPAELQASTWVGQREATP